MYSTVIKILIKIKIKIKNKEMVKVIFLKYTYFPHYIVFHRLGSKLSTF